MTAFVDAPPSSITNGHPLSRFYDMIAAYETCGGTARADELAMLLEEQKKGNFVSLAKGIASRDIFSFEWQNHSWVPMFQFNPQELSVKPEVRRVVHELHDVLDNWALALWFTKPNAWLKAKRPVDMVDSNFAEVLHAARADRIVATG